MNSAGWLVDLDGAVFQLSVGEAKLLFAAFAPDAEIERFAGSAQRIRVIIFLITGVRACRRAFFVTENRPRAVDGDATGF